MKIRNKILLAYGIGVFAFIIVFIVIELYISQKYEFTYNRYKEDLRNSINNVLKLRTADFQNILKESTQSEPLYLFTKTHDTVSVKRNLNILQNFKFSALWIYDSQSKLLYSDFNNNGLRKIHFPKESFDSLSHSNMINFYIYADSGLVEIMGSIIHSQQNRGLNNNISGYFYIARLWNKEYISGIENMLNLKIGISIPNNELITKDKTIITIIKRIHNLQNEPLAEISFTKKSQIATAFNRLNSFIMIFMLIFIVFLIILFIITFRRFIDYPLFVISEALNSGNTNQLKELTSHKDEFGKISKLIEDFFKQKKLLSDEIEERKKAEEAMRISEANYRSLYETIVHGVLRTTPRGIILNANSAFIKMLGYSSEEEVIHLEMGKDIYFYPDARKDLINLLNSTGKARNLEIVVRKKDGNPLICLINADYIYSTEGSVMYIQGTVTDISDYKKLETQIETLELAVKQSLEGMAILDLAKDFEFVNDAWAKMHGYVSEKMIGKNFNICYGSDKNSLKLINTLFEIVNENGYYTGDVTLLKSKGKPFKTLLSCSYVKDFFGKRIGYVIIANDITDRISAEEEIRRLNKMLEQKIAEQHKELIESNEKLIKIVDELQIKEKEITKSQQLYLSTINSTHEWIHFIDRDFNFVLINEAFLKINREIGVEESVVGKNIKEVFHFLDKQIFDEYDFVLETGKELITEEPTNFNGKYYYTETIKTPVIDSGNVVGVITTIRDITERKDMEKKILAAVVEAEEREKKRFSEDLHDGLGALLSTMKIYINTIQKKKSIEEASDLLVQLKEMIFDAVENTRSIAYNLTPNVLADFGLEKALSAYCDKINSTQSLDIAFESKYHERLNHNLEINLFRIMQELINNSFKHGEAKNINIKMEVVENKLFISYADDGKGFDTEKILGKKVGGIGINNIFARVKLLNGTCRIISHEGGGTRVNIDINNIN